MKVVAKTALTAVQGFSIPVGTVGEVKVMHTRPLNWCTVPTGEKMSMELSLFCGTV